MASRAIARHKESASSALSGITDHAVQPLKPNSEVSAKYKGAFCEARIKSVTPTVNVHVSCTEKGRRVVKTAKHYNVRGDLNVGSIVEILGANQTVLWEGKVNKLVDASEYVVVFDDGDTRNLRRNAIMPKGKRYFVNEQTLDDTPLTDPEKALRGNHSGDDSASEGPTVNGDTSASGLRSTPRGTPRSLGRRRPTRDSSDSELNSPEYYGPVEASLDDTKKYLGLSFGETARMCTVWAKDREDDTWKVGLVVPLEDRDDTMGHVSRGHIVIRFFHDRSYAAYRPGDLQPFDSSRWEGRKLPYALQQAMKFEKVGDVTHEMMWKAWRVRVKGEEEPMPTDDQSNGTTTTTGAVDADVDADVEADADADGGLVQANGHVKEEQEEGEEEGEGIGDAQIDDEVREDIDSIPGIPSRDAFTKRLMELREEHKVVLSREPQLGHQPLDFYLLFNLVKLNGGYEHLTESQGWREIYRALGLNITTSSANSVKTAYAKYLQPWESEFDALYVTRGSDSKRSSRASSKKDRSSRASPAGSDHAENALPPHGTLYAIGEMVRAMAPHDGEMYDAKVMDIKVFTKGELKRHQKEGVYYFLHWQGWNSRYDEWIHEEGVHSSTGVKKKIAQKDVLRTKARIRRVSQSHSAVASETNSEVNLGDGSETPSTSLRGSKRNPKLPQTPVESSSKLAVPRSLQAQVSETDSETPSRSRSGLRNSSRLNGTLSSSNLAGGYASDADSVKSADRPIRRVKKETRASLSSPCLHANGGLLGESHSSASTGRMPAHSRVTRATRHGSRDRINADEGSSGLENITLGKAGNGAVDGHAALRSPEINVTGDDGLQPSVGAPASEGASVLSGNSHTGGHTGGSSRSSKPRQPKPAPVDLTPFQFDGNYPENVLAKGASEESSPETDQGITKDMEKDEALPVDAGFTCENIEPVLACKQKIQEEDREKVRKRRAKIPKLFDLIGHDATIDEIRERRRCQSMREKAGVPLAIEHRMEQLRRMYRKRKETMAYLKQARADRAGQPHSQVHNEFNLPSGISAATKEALAQRLKKRKTMPEDMALHPSLRYETVPLAQLQRQKMQKTSHHSRSSGGQGRGGSYKSSVQYRSSHANNTVGNAAYDAASAAAAGHHYAAAAAAGAMQHYATAAMTVPTTGPQAGGYYSAYTAAAVAYPGYTGAAAAAGPVQSSSYYPPYGGPAAAGGYPPYTPTTTGHYPAYASASAHGYPSYSAWAASQQGAAVAAATTVGGGGGGGGYGPDAMANGPSPARKK
eukprot:Clim_evm6s15 gene=Clim_evmTU6s15